MKIGKSIFLDTLWVENFDEIARSRTVQEIEANLCFCNFGENFKIQNGRHFWGEENFFKLPRAHCLDTLWVEISMKSLYLTRFRR